jgi:hypothetical protein
VDDKVSGKSRRLTLGGSSRDIFKKGWNASRPLPLVIPRL